MKMKFFVSILVVLMLVVISCRRQNGFVVKVEPLKDSTKSGLVNGIPFYKKIPVFVQTSIYMGTFYEIKLFISERTVSKGIVNEKPKPVLLPAAVGFIDESDLNKCSDFLESAQGLSNCEEVINLFKSTCSTYQIKGVNDFKDENDTKDLRLYSNNIDSKMYIDWENLYYLNYKVPIAGKSSLTAELSAEGTLNKAVGETEEKTAETIIGAVSTFLPIKEFLTFKWIPATKEPQKKEIVISLMIEKKLCKYTLTKVHKNWYETLSKIELYDDSANKILEIIDSTMTKKIEKKDDTKNTIEFSGQVKIPVEEKNTKK